jgi:hypothetical protein
MRSAGKVTLSPFEGRLLGADGVAARVAAAAAGVAGRAVAAAVVAAAGVAVRAGVADAAALVIAAGVAGRAVGDA